MAQHIELNYIYADKGIVRNGLCTKDDLMDALRRYSLQVEGLGPQTGHFSPDGDDTLPGMSHRVIQVDVDRDSAVFHIEVIDSVPGVVAQQMLAAGTEMEVLCEYSIIQDKPREKVTIVRANIGPVFKGE